MKKQFVSLATALALVTLMLLSCQKSTPTQEAGSSVDSSALAMNSLTEEEKAGGWELLFDGTSLNGWKRYNHDSIGPLWTVKEGILICDGTGFGEGSLNGGSLMTIRTFGNFELTADWKLSPGGNSGILYHVIENKKYEHDYETGPEFQVMDDSGWKDSLRDAQKAGGSYDMFAAPATKKLNPVGEWNTIKLIYNNGHVEHWLNGEKVVEFEENSPAFVEAYKKSKWVEYPDWNKSKAGAISLQDHGAPVYYKNIKVKTL